MTKEEELDWLCRLRSEIYVYMPKEWLIPMNNALDMAISALSENKGEWKMPIQDDGMSDPIYYQVRCSKCGFDLDPQTWHQELHQYGADNFCPNCGADMRGET